MATLFVGGMFLSKSSQATRYSLACNSQLNVEIKRNMPELCVSLTENQKLQQGLAVKTDSLHKVTRTPEYFEM